MRIALFGYGGHAREVAAQIGKKVTFFVDDEHVNENTQSIKLFNPSEYVMMVAVADTKDRKRIVESLPKETQYFTFIHPTALLMDSNIEIGEGSFVGAYSILTTNIKLGKHSILNRGVQIGHDCNIGDYFSAMPGSVVSGNVSIGSNVYIGNNSSIKEKKFVVSDVIVGSNATVVKNIISGGIYVGVPAKKIK